MEVKMKREDWIFFLLCLLLAIVAEEAFFRGQVGISYLVFIIPFYMLFYWRFRSFTFTHQRMSYLLLISIWLLSAGYYLYDTALFYLLNIVVIPTLVIIQLVLMTLPRKMPWNQPLFFINTLFRLGNGIRYSVTFTKYLTSFVTSSNEKRTHVLKKVLIGILIALPLLILILNLLIEADTQFARLVSILPELVTIRVDYILRVGIVLIYLFGFFGFMQVLLQKNSTMIQRKGASTPVEMDGIIPLTVLLLLDLVYVLFVAVQFKYFFGGSLDAGYTYAEYARRGFFELVLVSLINLTVTTTVIQFTKKSTGFLKQTIRVTLTILVLASGVLLLSAFMRLTMYEDAYGFTFTRILAHSFMIFLLVILAYTLVKIWLEKLSLVHFYFIASLLYYTGINVVNIDRMVVERNIARFEATGKVDINYLNNLSATGILGLIHLYEGNPDVPGLKKVLIERKTNRAYLKNEGWQSNNLTRNQAYEKLGELDL